MTSLRYKVVGQDSSQFGALLGGTPSGSPVLMLHGFGGTGISWLGVAAQLEGCQIIGPDLPGHGGSKALFSSPTLDGLAEGVEDILQSVDLREAHVIAHSMGGAVALQLLGRQRLKFKSLALLSCAGLCPDYDRDFFRLYMEADSPCALRSVLGRAVGTGFDVNALMARSAYAALGDARDILKQLVEAGRENAFLAPIDVLDDLQGPLAVIWGSNDRITPPANTVHLARWAQPVFLDGIGHLPHIEAAKQTAAVLGSNIKKAGQPGS